MNINDIKYELEAKPYIDGLRRWKWEWHVTIRSNYPHTSLESITKKTKSWLNWVMSEYPGLKVAGILFPVNPPNRRLHLHGLILSTDNSVIQLNEIPREQRSYLQDHFLGSYYSCKITTCHDWKNKVVCTYMHKEKNANIWNPDSYMTSYFNPSRLNQMKSENIY